MKHIHGIGHPIVNPKGELVQERHDGRFSERKRAEQARERVRPIEADLAHTNPVSTMSELTASLDHEIKQPICAAAIIDRVRSLYKKGASQLELVDLNQVIDEMVIMMGDEANRHRVTNSHRSCTGTPRGAGRLYTSATGVDESNAEWY